MMYNQNKRAHAPLTAYIEHTHIVNVLCLVRYTILLVQPQQNSYSRS